MEVVGECSRAYVWKLRTDQPGKTGWNQVGKNLRSSIQGHMRDLTSNGVSAGK